MRSGRNLLESQAGNLCYMVADPNRHHVQREVSHPAPSGVDELFPVLKHGVEGLHRHVGYRPNVGSSGDEAIADTGGYRPTRLSM